MCSSSHPDWWCLNSATLTRHFGVRIRRRAIGRPRPPQATTRLQRTEGCPWTPCTRQRDHLASSILQTVRKPSAELLHAARRERSGTRIVSNSALTYKAHCCVLFQFDKSENYGEQSFHVLNCEHGALNLVMLWTPPAFLIGRRGLQRT